MVLSLAAALLLLNISFLAAAVRTRFQVSNPHPLLTLCIYILTPPPPNNCYSLSSSPVLHFPVSGDETKKLNFTSSLKLKIKLEGGLNVMRLYIFLFVCVVLGPAPVQCSGRGSSLLPAGICHVACSRRPLLIQQCELFLHNLN